MRGKVDTFAAFFDTENANLVIPFGQIGSLGAYWGFQGINGYCAMGITGCVFDPNATEEEDGGEFYADLDYVTYKATDDGKLKLVDLEIPTGYVMEWGSRVCEDQGDVYKNLGYFAAYDFTTTTDWVKAVASSSVKSTNKVEFNYKKELLLKEKTLKKLYRK